LILIAFYGQNLGTFTSAVSHAQSTESVFRSKQNHWIKTWFHQGDDGEEDTPQVRDPETSEQQGLQISKVKFDELVRHFPNTELSTEATLMRELREVRSQLDEVLRRLDAVTATQKSKGKKGRKKSGSSSSSSSD
jgi:hypothetical protein